MSKRFKDQELWVKVLIVLVILFLIPIAIKVIRTVWEEFKDTRQQAQYRHEMLQERLATRQALKAKLEKRFRYLYFAVRLVLVLLWSALLGTLYYFGLVSNLEDALNYSEALLLLWCTINFLFYGNFSNIKASVKNISLRLENKVWAEHLDLDEKIEADKAELVKLQEA